MEQKNKIKVPKFALVFFGTAVLSIIILLISLSNVAFADFFNRYVSSIFRAALATITNVLPLSLAELPIILFLVVRSAVKKFSNSWRDVGVFCVSLLSIVALLFSAFIFIFGIGYHTYSLDKKLELDELAKKAKDAGLSRVSTHISSIGRGTRG